MLSFTGIDLSCWLSSQPKGYALENEEQMLCPKAQLSGILHKLIFINK